ncbi:MAG TPA: hypothetical protein VF485_13590 [Sphingomonas sp.]
MSRSANTRPSERRIGARVRIKPLFQAQLEALLAQVEIEPIHKELRTDGDISYWFDREQVAALGEARVLERIPLHWWAHYAIVGDTPTIN